MGYNGKLMGYTLVKSPFLLPTLFAEVMVILKPLLTTINHIYIYKYIMVIISFIIWPLHGTNRSSISPELPMS